MEPASSTISGAEPPELARLRVLARVLDTAVGVPGTKFRFGADAVIGMVPFAGDAVGLGIGSYILMSAIKLGVPQVVIGRMLLNLAFDALLGAVPFLGDFLDATFRANSRNIVLLERAVAQPTATRRASTAVVVGVFAAVGLIGIAGLVLSVWLLRLLWRQIA